MNFNWLKNKKFTVIAAVLSTMLAAGTLAGCSNVSKSDFDALEKRVEALEKVQTTRAEIKTHLRQTNQANQLLLPKPHQSQALITESLTPKM